MDKIGFSTGCLYKAGYSVEEACKIYHEFGTNAIELSFAKPSALLDFKLSKDLFKSLEKYEHVSVHAPWKDIEYGFDDDTLKVLDKLYEFNEKIDLKGVVFHPDVVDDFYILETSSLPCLVENMDTRKNSGTVLKDFYLLKRNYNFGFVLDVEHAYQHDNTMKLAGEFFDVMGKRLNHLHVSGESESRSHCPVYCSDNKNEIAKVLRKDFPIILEGSLGKDYPEEIPRELDFF